MYGETPTDFFKEVEAYRKVSDFYYSIGVTLDSSGRIAEVLWNSPAFKAGLSQGFTVIAVNGKAYKPELLRGAISAAKVDRQPIEFLLRQADRYQTTRIAGARFSRSARRRPTGYKPTGPYLRKGTAR